MVARKAPDIRGLRRANRAVARLLQELGEMATPGVTTRDLDAYAYEYITGMGGNPVFNTEKGFPGCINTSVNDAVVHGVPGTRPLRAGDVLSIDAGMLLEGYAGDATITVGIGEILPAHRRLIETTRKALAVGVAAARSGKRVGDIGAAIQGFAESQGYGVIREYIGHGLGHKMHEDPQVPSVGKPHTGPVMPEGLVITIEPILVERSPDVAVDPDGWTVRTVDGGWAAQFEHTVIVERGGGRVLSLA